MSSYVQKILLPNERVVAIAIRHWIMYVSGITTVILGGVLGTFSHFLLRHTMGLEIAGNAYKPLSAVALVIVLIGAGQIFSAYVRQVSTEIVVTDHRLIIKYGVLARTTYEMMLNRVTGANFNQTVTGRLLDFGTIWIHGAGGEVVPIGYVSAPQAFYKALMGRLENPQNAPKNL